MNTIPEKFRVIGLNFQIIANPSYLGSSNRNTGDGLRYDNELVFPDNAAVVPFTTAVNEVHVRAMPQLISRRPEGESVSEDMLYFQTEIDNLSTPRVSVITFRESESSLKNPIAFYSDEELQGWLRETPWEIGVISSLPVYRCNVDLVHCASLIQPGSETQTGYYAEVRAQRAPFAYKGFEPVAQPPSSFIFRRFKAKVLPYKIRGVRGTNYIDASLKNIMIAPYRYNIDPLERSKGGVLWPVETACIKPTDNFVGTFTNGTGTSIEYGRPITNGSKMGVGQRAVYNYGPNYWIGPAAANSKELYIMEPFDWDYPAIEGVTLEALCGAAEDYYPVPADWEFLLHRGTEEVSIPWHETDRGKITFGGSGDNRMLVSVYLPYDPFTSANWKKEDINNTYFGFRIPASSPDPTKIRFYGFNAVIAASPSKIAHLNFQNTIPIYPELDPVIQPSKLQAADVGKLNKATAHRLYMDVRKPQTVAVINILPTSRNRLSDSSFENFGLSPEESAWEATGNVISVPKAIDWPYDGKFCIAVGEGGKIKQDIDILPTDIGDRWRLGGAIAARTGEGEIGLKVTFTTETQTYTYKVTQLAQEMAPNLWYPKFSGEFIVPTGATLATVETIWTPTGGHWGFFDCIVLGIKDVTIKDAEFEPFLLRPGDAYVPVGSFESGGWDNLVEGQTLKIGNFKARLAGVFPDVNLIKVAESSIPWQEISQIEVLDTHDYWLRYQRIVDLNKTTDPNIEAASRDGALAFVESTFWKPAP